MVELSVECRPSVHQDEAGKSTVRMDSERNPAVLSPITIEPIVGVSTIRADFTYGDPISANSEKMILISAPDVNSAALANSFQWYSWPTLAKRRPGQ
jgi:hypothetical protein